MQKINKANQINQPMLTKNIKDVSTYTVNSHKHSKNSAFFYNKHIYAF